MISVSLLLPSITDHAILLFAAISQGVPFAAASTGAITKRELGSLLEAFRGGNKEDIVVKEILKIVKDVREIQSNQVCHPFLFLIREIVTSLM